MLSSISKYNSTNTIHMSNNEFEKKTRQKSINIMPFFMSNHVLKKL